MKLDNSKRSGPADSVELLQVADELSFAHSVVAVRVSVHDEVLFEETQVGQAQR